MGDAELKNFLKLKFEDKKFSTSIMPVVNVKRDKLLTRLGLPLTYSKYSV